MKFSTLSLMPSGLLSLIVLSMGPHVALANGFFQDDTGAPINDAYNIDYMPLDSFINDARNPHNYYNPFKLNSAAQQLSFVAIEKTHSSLSPGMQQIGDSLEKKSEQAIKHNNLSQVRDSSEESTHSSGMNLSQITSSSLILSARKKQFFEKLFPALLSNHNMTSRDRKRLARIAGFFEHNSAIGADDENWLKQLENNYRYAKDGLKKAD